MLVYLRAPGYKYFQVFLHFLLYMNCLSKTFLTFQPDPPTLCINPGVFAHLFSAASNFGRSPSARQIQQSYQQHLWRWSSADLLRRRGFSWTQIYFGKCLVRCSVVLVATARRAWLETRATRSHERTRAHGKFHSPRQSTHQFRRVHARTGFAGARRMQVL